MNQSNQKTVGLASALSWPAWLVLKLLQLRCRLRSLPEDISSLGYPFRVLPFEIAAEFRAAFCHYSGIPLYWFNGTVVYQGCLSSGTVAYCNGFRMHRSWYERPWSVQVLDPNLSIVDITLTTAVLFPFPYYQVSTLGYREASILTLEDR